MAVLTEKRRRPTSASLKSYWRFMRMTPEEEGSEVREMVWEMSRMTNRILLLGILLILAILAVLKYSGVL